MLGGWRSCGAGQHAGDRWLGGTFKTGNAVPLPVTRLVLKLPAQLPMPAPPMQRYLVALLTAAHQHNSGAAAAAAAGEAEGGGAGAPAAAVAPLAAAMAGKQLLLHAPGGATDIRIAVA